MAVEWTDAELIALTMYRHAGTHEDAREAEEDLRALVAAREAQAAAKALIPGGVGRSEGGRTAVSGVEALTLVLHSTTYPWCRQPTVPCGCATQAERILANPAPLLEALAEAGVLRNQAERGES